MLTIVGVVACLVQIYSLGYMAGDPGYGRYYAFQSLFAWAMMNMVIAGSMLQLFIFWETGRPCFVFPDRFLLREMERIAGRQEGLCHEQGR